MNNDSKSTSGSRNQGDGDSEAARRNDKSVESQQEAADLERIERVGQSDSQGEDRDIQSGSSKS